ncbi:MAG: DJ-1/PfpI family protein [Candidatus Zixiibacteriota bacterium]
MLKIAALLSIAATFIILIVGCADNNISANQSNDSKIDILLLVSRNYGANYFLYRDLYDQYGWNVTHAGVLKEIPACPPYYYRYKVPVMVPDIMTSEIKDVAKYEGIAIMPSTGVFSPVPFDEFINDRPTLQLITTAVQKNIPVISSCAGSRVLAAADVIKGKTIIGNPEFKAECEAAGATVVDKDHPPLFEGSIITTARGMYYSVANCMALATAIEERQPKGKHPEYPDKEFIFSDVVNFAKDTIVWGQTFGGFAADGAQAFCETENGGFLIVGYTFSHGTGDADILVVKTDAEGKKVWTKTYGGAGTEYGYGCLPVEDGYIITGYTTSYGSGSKDVYLIKADTKGNEVWSKTFGGASWDVGAAVAKTDDGGLIVCGFTQSSGNGEEDVYLIRTDAKGNEIWSKTFGEERSEMGNSVYASGDGGFIIGATTGTTKGGNSDFYLIKTDADGNAQWSKKYATNGSYGHGFDWCSSMCPTKDGGYIMAGYSDCEDIMNAHAIRVDSQGNEIWSKSFGNSKFYDYAYSVRNSRDGGYIVGGTTKSVDSTKIYNNDFYLVKLDAVGNIARQQVIGGAGLEWGAQVRETENGDIIIVGQTNDRNSESFDVCMIKVSGAD